MRSSSFAMSSPGVRLGLARGSHDHLREAVHAPSLLVLHPLRRLEVLQLAAEVDGELARIESGDIGRAGFTRDQVRPAGLDVVSERRHHAEPRHDHASSAVVSHLHPQSTVDEQHLARDERGRFGA